MYRTMLQEQQGECQMQALPYEERISIRTEWEQTECVCSQYDTDHSSGRHDYRLVTREAQRSTQ